MTKKEAKIIQSGLKPLNIVCLVFDRLPDGINDVLNVLEHWAEFKASDNWKLGRLKKSIVWGDISRLFYKLGHNK
jgi:hypothetical protein